MAKKKRSKSAKEKLPLIALLTLIIQFLTATVMLIKEILEQQLSALEGESPLMWKVYHTLPIKTIMKKTFYAMIIAGILMNTIAIAKPNIILNIAAIAILAIALLLNHKEKGR